MPWYFPWSESIKKRACRYLLQHYLGDFLKEKLDLDQLTVDLYNGKGTVKKVPLDVWALNEILSNTGIPVELVDGFIESISVCVPWKALLNDSCEIEIHGLQLVFASRPKFEGNLMESTNTWNSMTTSIQMAQECLRQDPTGDTTHDSGQFEGLEAFAQTIESVLARVRLSFVNTKIRMEHLSLSATSGVGIDLTIDRIDYWDLSHEEVGKENTPQHSVYEPVAVAIKNFQMLGVNLFIEEFPKRNQTQLRDLYSSDEDLASIPLTPISEGLSRFQRAGTKENDKGDELPNLIRRVKFLSSCGKQNIKVRLKQTDNIPGPKFDMEYSLGALNVFMTPRQLHLLSDVASSLTDAAESYSSVESKGTGDRGRMKMREMRSEDFVKVEESLQQHQQQQQQKQQQQRNQFPSVDSQDWRRGGGGGGDMSSLKDTPYSSLTKPRSNSDDEFFSMTESPLPSLGQPTLLNTVKQCNLTGQVFSMDEHFGTANNTTDRFSSASPRSTLSNVSLGGSSGSLNSKGTLTEKASTVFRGSLSGSPNQRTTTQPFVSPVGSFSNVGLAGMNKIDDNTDMTKVRLRASNIICILLHRDPFLANMEKSNAAGDSGNNSLDEMSKHFFDHVDKYSIQNLFDMINDEVREKLLKLSSYDHIRILASAVSVETESGAASLNTDIMIGKLAIDENLYDERQDFKPYCQVQLLRFEQQNTSPLYPGAFSQSPAVKISVSKNNRNTLSGVHPRGTTPPKSQIKVDFSQFVLDLDLSIMDRIASLLWPGSLYKTTNLPVNPFHNMYNSLATGASANHHSDFKQVIHDTHVHVDCKTDVICRCPVATILLRVPIPDLCPSSDIKKKAWWKRSVYDEHLKLEVTSFEFKTLLSSLKTTLMSYDMKFKQALGFFVMSNEQQHHMFDIDSTTEEGDTGCMGVDVPRILLNVMPASSRSVLEATENAAKDSSPDSIEDQYPWMKSEPSPFSTNPSMYNENEEMVTPGTIREMNEFQEFVSTSAKTCVNCYFPSMQVNLQTNEIFEMFYNRIFGALLLWEPSAPSPVDFAMKTTNTYDASLHINLASHIGLENTIGGDRFFMCRSSIRNDGFDSHSTDENSFFSTDFAPKHEQQTNLCFSLHIDKGNVAIFPPAKFLENTADTFETAPEESAVGHMVFNIEDGHLFVAAGFKGNPDIDFIEIYSNTIELYHCSLLNEALQLNLMEDALCTDYLEKTIYLSVPSANNKRKSGASVGLKGEEPMLSVAMKSTSYVDQKRKDNVVSVAIRSGTLDHRVLPAGHSWLTQIMDFMDIEDFPITGYTYPKVMTTLHMHLWGCAVDYRPKHIPIHALLTMESLNLSSNIIPGSSTSMLRFIIEDSALHICDKTYLDTGDFNDFVTVMDMGTFELSLKFTNGSDPRQPAFDMSMSNNMLNFRTCADSCVALMKLIKYFASDGDLEPSVNTEPDTETEDSSGALRMPSQTVSEGHSEESLDIHALLADAMDDTEESVDERFQGTVIDECFGQNDSYDDSDYDDDDDDDGDEGSGNEFCLLDNNQATEDIEEFEPVIRELTNCDIVIMDDFISPPEGKHDLLLSPEGFPTATHRYTIKEISIVWQMYGGSDFGHSSRSSSCSSQSSDGRQPTKVPSFGGRQDNNKTNRAKGGPNRDVDTLMELQMNKIRFQHENYPEDAKQIYRVVLLVYDVEVRDRLCSSKINKFLYQYSSESMPKRSSTNMIAVRFLVVKPEDSARSEEASLRISVQPLRLNVDQPGSYVVATLNNKESLFFMRDFFSKVSGTTKVPEKRPPSQPDFSTTLSSSPGVEPFQTVKDSPAPSPKMAEEPLKRRSVSSESIKSEKQQPPLFIKSFLFSPEVPIRLDYQGKYVDIEQGTISGLIMGLSQLKCSELRLKRLCSRSGILGADKLLNFMMTEWLNDIKQNQLQSILGGLGPTYSFIQLFQGLKDLLWMPVQQYRRDGRIVRGLQRGAHSFSTSTAMAVLELSNRLVTTVQSLAELTFDMVSSGPSHSSALGSSQTVHPAELREGFAKAYTVLTEGFTQTAQNLVRVATEEHDKKGMTGAVGGVLRQIPSSVVKPIIIATEATSNVLGGAMNQLEPDKRKEALEKWKTDS